MQWCLDAVLLKDEQKVEDDEKIRIITLRKQEMLIDKFIKELETEQSEEKQEAVRKKQRLQDDIKLELKSKDFESKSKNAIVEQIIRNGKRYKCLLGEGNRRPISIKKWPVQDLKEVEVSRTKQENTSNGPATMDKKMAQEVDQTTMEMPIETSAEGSLTTSSPIPMDVTGNFTLHYKLQHMHSSKNN